jgi:hypothetical protein
MVTQWPPLADRETPPFGTANASSNVNGCKLTGFAFGMTFNDWCVCVGPYVQHKGARLCI